MIEAFTPPPAATYGFDAEGQDEQETPSESHAKNGMVYVDAGKTVVSANGKTRVLIDCAINVICIYEQAGVHNMAVEITRNGHKFRARLDAATMEDKKKWNAWASCIAMADWDLSTFDRRKLKTYLLHQTGAERVIHLVDTAGILSDHGIILCAGHSIDSTGGFIKPDDRGIFRLRCKDNVVRDFELPENATASVPRIDDVSPSDDEARRSLRGFMGSLQTYLAHHGGSVALGWVAANAVRDELMAHRDAFPHLYLCGRHQAGKNVLGRVLYHVAGMGHVGCIDATSSKVAIRNRLAELAGFPLWVNELDGTESSMRMLGQIRAAFDGQAQEVGVRDKTANRMFQVKRGFILSGQHIIGSDAEMSRYCIIRLDARRRNDAALAEVHAEQKNAAAAFARLLGNRVRMANMIVTFAQQFYEVLSTLPTHIDNRQAWCWSCCLAGLRYLWSAEGPDTNALEALPEGAMEDVLARALDAQLTRRSEGAIGQFWSIVESLDAQGRLNNSGSQKWVAPHTSNGKTYTALWVAHLYQVVISMAPRAGFQQICPRVDSLMTEFQEEAGFVAAGKQVKLENAPRQCAIFEQDSKCIPEWVKQKVTTWV